MSEIIKFINRFEILTYCFEGYLLQIYINFTYLKKYIPENGLYSFILAYFLGFMISRISSLVIEKFLSRNADNSNLRFIPIATNKDENIRILNTNKIFIRNLFTTLTLIECIDFFLYILYFKNYKHIIFELMIIILLIILYNSYLKNQKYLMKRINLFLSTEELTVENQFLSEIIYEELKYTLCPCCNNKNFITNKDLNIEVCYKCGSKYNIV